MITKKQVENIIPLLRRESIISKADAEKYQYSMVKRQESWLRSSHLLRSATSSPNRNGWPLEIQCQNDVIELNYRLSWLLWRNSTPALLIFVAGSIYIIKV